MSRDLGRLSYESFIYWEPDKASNEPTKFNGHGHCGSGNTIVLVCQVISSNRSLSCQVTTLPGFVCYIFEMEI